MDAIDESFTTRLRAVLADRELSQAELARRTGIAASTLNKIVHGKRRPNAKDIGAIAHELEVDLLELVGVAAALDQLAAVERHANAAEARAETTERARFADAAAHAQAQAALANRIAQLEANCRALADERDASELARTTLAEQLQAAQDRLALLEIVKRNAKPSRTTPLDDWEPPVFVPANDVDRYAPARQRASTIGSIARNLGGGLIGAFTEAFVYNRAVKRIDGV